MIAFVLLIALSSAMDFQAWVAKHKKHFTPSEMLRRKAIFRQNQRLAVQFNKDSSFKLSTDGPFAAMTNAEYRNTLKRIIVDRSAVDEVKTAIKGIPASIDWRQTNKVPAVRDQGGCGSCYSFASLAAVESRLLIAGSKFTNQNIDLSEQQIVDCSTKQGNQGCNGGSLAFTFRYVKVNGAMKESDYAYTEKQGTCNYAASKVVVKIGGQGSVASGDENALATAVAEGPVAVAIDASRIKFQLYKDGVYDDAACSSTQLNHGVAVVGYGTEGSTDYWIVRNSWGASWGASGYIKMARNKNNQCGIATGAFYPTGVVDA